MQGAVDKFKWKCPLCNKKTSEDKEEHILNHIDEAQQFESEWYEAGVEARILYKKLFKKEA